MATADEYAAWIVKNADKRGTPEFDTVAKAYEMAKADPATPVDDRPPLMRTMQNLVGGAVRGAGSIGATVPGTYEPVALPEPAATVTSNPLPTAQSVAPSVSTILI